MSIRFGGESKDGGAAGGTRLSGSPVRQSLTALESGRAARVNLGSGQPLDELRSEYDLKKLRDGKLTFSTDIEQFKEQLSDD